MARRRIRSAILDILFLAIIAVLAFGLFQYMFSTIPVLGVSMETTLHDNDKVLVYKIGKYDYGDIVVFNTHLIGDGGERYFVKRIIGLPNDEISIYYDDDDKKFYVWRNGERLEEEYIQSDSPMTAEMPAIVVPQGEFFFLGDNRGESSDSRTGLMGKLDSITGRVVARYHITQHHFDFEFIKRREA
ncbi:MAG: signal peptidase I [Clostridia bacterium]|nr:signal peptidase I [Clostridia bacterium]